MTKNPKQIVRDMISKKQQVQTSGNYEGSQYDLGGGEDKAKKNVELYYAKKKTKKPIY